MTMTRRVLQLAPQARHDREVISRRFKGLYEPLLQEALLLLHRDPQAGQPVPGYERYEYSMGLPINGGGLVILTILYSYTETQVMIIHIELEEIAVPPESGT
ncbi:MAG: hypothetical protein LBG06_12245 [Deltaproteobacteria bacterium]|jgi:hypothetical protein|nr:hypothetical protein [Deltaproteobacteria bacterium]